MGQLPQFIGGHVPDIVFAGELALFHLLAILLDRLQCQGLVILVALCQSQLEGSQALNIVDDQYLAVGKPPRANPNRWNRDALGNGLRQFLGNQFQHQHTNAEFFQGQRSF